jgi:hypothetical protein
MAHLAGQTGKYISLKEHQKISWWLDTVPGLIYNIDYENISNSKFP